MHEKYLGLLSIITQSSGFLYIILKGTIIRSVVSQFSGAISSASSICSFTVKSYLDNSWAWWCGSWCHWQWSWFYLQYTSPTPPCLGCFPYKTSTPFSICYVPLSIWNKNIERLKLFRKSGFKVKDD